MKRVIAIMALFLGLASGVACAEEAFTTEEEKVGYAIGMNLGITMQSSNVTADPDQIAAGLKAILKGEPTLMTVQEMGQVLIVHREKRLEMQKKQMEEMNATADDILVKSKEFMAQNAKQDGVVTLESGLQYKVLSSGYGASPGADTMVQVHYRGTLVDGTEFDSSHKYGEPVSFNVNRVIPGWTEALQLMKEGDKWLLAIPPELAYGEKGAPPVVPPNAALVFEVELLKVLN
ncbi:MAG: FKBP-type peptidyl-prolyl cis-trans isomerase [Deltaproteobacteria bacterium]|jgi:FKBP-type peptidyl-prolyl cis-trans isomerase FklB|nr:FKBP-type peptidyl-prolyl cis-trans isomerase [Deltaproteobacteria bacterium]